MPLGQKLLPLNTSVYGQNFLSILGVLKGKTICPNRRKCNSICRVRSCLPYGDDLIVTVAQASQGPAIPRMNPPASRRPNAPPGSFLRAVDDTFRPTLDTLIVIGASQEPDDSSDHLDAACKCCRQSFDDRDHLLDAIHAGARGCDVFICIPGQGSSFVDVEVSMAFALGNVLRAATRRRHATA